MIKNILTYSFIFILFLSFSNLINAQGDSSGVVKVYTFDIKEMIAPPVWRTTKLAMENAAKMNAGLILIHMNTYGGTLDDADSIRTKILNSKIPVYVFIDKNAASAGALISIACDSIYMAPGASIGAATVVNQNGEPLPDKYQSYMRSMMRATAEAKGRDALIAQAMVDPRLNVPGVSDSGQVLTFTTSEAIQHNYCEGEAHNLEEVLKHAGIENYTFINHEITALDKMIGWLINPFVSGILIMIIIGGIYFELQSPGIGFPLAAASLAALLYFAPLYLEGLANHWEILLFVVGIALVLVEIFAIPGFGVTGVSGIVLIITGLTLSMVGNIGPGTFDYDFSMLSRSFFIVIISFFLALIVSFFITKKLFTTSSFGHLALSSTQQASEGFTSASADYSNMLHKTGIAKTILRPAGKIDIDGNLYDATAITGYIDKDEKVVVVNYQTSQLIVKKSNDIKS
jgi:membrane-bound serine protease (ClpP class)